MKTTRYKLFAIGCAICVVILIVLNSWPEENKSSDHNSIADLVVVTERDPWKAVVRNYTPSAWVSGYDSSGHTMFTQITSFKIDFDTIPCNQIGWLIVEDTIINTITYAYHEKRNYPKVRKGYHKCPVNNLASDFDDGLKIGIESLLYLKSWYNNDSTSCVYEGGTGIDINTFLGGNNRK